MFTKQINRRSLVLGSAAAFAVAPLAGYGIVAAQDAPAEYVAPDNIGDISGTYEADGSSTVAPLIEAVIEEFAAVAPGIQINNGVSGTGGGFERFGLGETALSNASRPIKAEEAAVAAENGVSYYEFEVAYDGLTVVVSAENDFVTELTVEQLAGIWQDGGFTTWDQVNPEWPAETIELYGPGADSGTFDYFNEVILGEELSPRTDYNPSEDDNVLVQGVSGSPYALGYFGFAYYEANADLLKAVSVDGGSGAVAPSIETISDKSYAPLSRPLFEYANASMLQAEQGLQEFLRFYLASSGELAAEVGYIALPGDIEAAQQAKLEGAITGEVAPDSDGGSATPAA